MRGQFDNKALSPTCNDFQIDAASASIMVPFVQAANNDQVVYMAILLKVECVDLSNHPDPCQRITHIGGSSGKIEWKHTHNEAIQFIELNSFHYYVENDGRALKLEVGLAPNGGKFLKTQADGGHSQLLMNLPERPKLESRQSQDEHA
jgi:hypothetical protein